MEAHSRGRDVAAGYRRGKTGSALDGQGLPVALYQCKTDYFLRQRGHFTFYKLQVFFGVTLILKAEGGAEKEKQKKKEKETRAEKKRADKKHL